MAVNIKNQLGKIDISNDVIATVVGGASTEIFGIVGMASKNQIRENRNRCIYHCRLRYKNFRSLPKCSRKSKV